jgi:hypothetical protein|tara:strand:+ start:284 stop:394 length:111 start_codon:yes stop_codon:yes gene_type:complete
MQIEEKPDLKPKRKLQDDDAPEVAYSHNSFVKLKNK